MGATWEMGIVEGTAAQLHAASARTISAGVPPVRRALTLMRPAAPAIVLGSTQKISDVDVAEAGRRGYQVARRQSGGGAVVVGAGESVWIDLAIPAGDPLWDDDVAVAAWWVGDLWAGVLSDLGIPALEVWKGPLRTTPWSRRVCFAGVGPGEVLSDGRKVLGVSQRRTRHGALFQTATLLRWAPEDLTAVFGPAAPDPGAGGAGDRADLTDVAVGIGSGRAEGVWDALRAHLMP